MQHPTAHISETGWPPEVKYTRTFTLDGATNGIKLFLSGLAQVLTGVPTLI